MSDIVANNSPEAADEASEAAAGAQTLLAGLMQTRVLHGEDEGLLQRLSAEVVAKAQPRDVFEEMYLLDYIHNAWEVLRLRRYKDNLLLARASRGVKTVLDVVYHDEESNRELTREWRGGDPDGTRSINVELADVGLTMDAPMAVTLAQNLSDFERLDDLLEIAYRRRAVALRELEHHRTTLAAQAQKAADEFADAEFKVVGDFHRVDGDEDERLRSP
jgi:hypothetical protein